MTCVQCGEEFETRVYEDRSDMCDHCRCEWCGDADEPTNKIRDYSGDFARDVMACDRCRERYREGIAREGYGDHMRDLAKDGGR